MLCKKNVKIISATLLGNIFEFYDFIIFGFMLKYMQNIFLPDYSSTSKYILSFLLFSIGYLGRPIGAYILGKLGDQEGRRISIATSIIILTFSTCLIGLLPTYQQIGIAAPIILIILRLVQNFAVSVEQVGGALFLIESFPQNKGYIVSSLIFGTVYLGHVIGLVLMLLLVNNLSESQIIAWGWRLPFLLALPMGCFTGYLRLNMPESQEFLRYKSQGLIKKNSYILKKQQVLHAIGAFLSLSSSAYLTMIYIPNMLNFNQVLPAQQIFLFTILISILVFSTAMICGVTAERGNIAGLKLQNVALIATIVFALPMYVLLTSGVGKYILLAHIMSAVLLGMQTGTILGVIYNLYDFANRFLIINVGFNIAMTFFGGLTPFIAAYLSQVVHVLAPAVYLMMLSGITLLVVNNGNRMRSPYRNLRPCHPELLPGISVAED